MQLTGEIYLIGKGKHINEKLTIREFTLLSDKNGSHPQYHQLQMLNSRGDILNQFNVGDQVVVDVNVKGRLSKEGDKAYNSLEAWKVNKAQ